MPKSFGGLVGFVVAAVLSVVVGLWVVNRVAFLRELIAPKQAA